MKYNFKVKNPEECSPEDKGITQVKNPPTGVAPEISLPQAMLCRNKFSAILLKAAAVNDFFCSHPMHFATLGQLLALTLHLCQSC